MILLVGYAKRQPQIKRVDKKSRDKTRGEQQAECPADSSHPATAEVQTAAETTAESDSCCTPALCHSRR